MEVLSRIFCSFLLWNWFLLGHIIVFKVIVLQVEGKGNKSFINFTLLHPSPTHLPVASYPLQPPAQSKINAHRRPECCSCERQGQLS